MWRFLGASDKPWSSLVASIVKNLPAVQKIGFDSSGRKIPWRREWLPTLVYLPGEFHGQKSLVGYSPWACKELDMTKRLTVSLRSLNQVITVQTPGLWNKLFPLQGALLPVLKATPWWILGPNRDWTLDCETFCDDGMQTAQHDPGIIWSYKFENK